MVKNRAVQGTRSLSFLDTLGDHPPLPGSNLVRRSPTQLDPSTWPGRKRSGFPITPAPTRIYEREQM